MNSRKFQKRRMTEAENYGWVVDENDAWEAYELYCEYKGKDYVDSAIVDTLSVDELASSLAFLFRNDDFREWDRYKNGDDDDYEESYNARRRMRTERLSARHMPRRLRRR